MTRYLIVAHQTADSPELVEAVRAIRGSNPDAEFGLVVPATPVAHLGRWTQGESRTIAAEAGERARARLAAEGVELSEVTVGDPNPVYAVADAFNREPWDHVVVSTLAAGASRWLKMDVVSRMTRELAVPVTHIAAE
jgi:hypothetical protein